MARDFPATTLTFDAVWHDDGRPLIYRVLEVCLRTRKRGGVASGGVGVSALQMPAGGYTTGAERSRAAVCKTAAMLLTSSGYRKQPV